MIIIDHVYKSFGDVHAVCDLSLAVPRGELFCFLGPNGAGKTTTIKLLTGLLRPDRGALRIGGFDIQKQPVDAKRLIGYIPDMPYLYDRLTAVEFLKFVGDLYAVPRGSLDTRVDNALAQFGLDAYRTGLIGDFSHGMRQRLIYAATFLHDPKVVFIDEPLIGLDPFTIRMIKNFLRSHARAGMTIFLTTHILALAEEIADRIGIIHNGRMIALGAIRDLRQQAGMDGGLEDLFLKLTEAG
jgi:ABC-2 type transport system ATP-binding protein